MADIWDITEHVESHPDDHEQRWRLAKKLYGACEYDKALEHLAYLRQHWEPTINARRYLAATYYRLGRYDEAVEELRGAVQLWPEEISLREQLTRALEAVGAHAEALEAWTFILRRQPEHPLGQKALTRLKKKADKDKKNELDSSGGMGSKAPGFFATSAPCPQCGAANLEDVAKCWQCGAQLKPDSQSDSGLSEEAPQVLVISPETMGMTVIGILVALLLLSGFLTLNLFGAFSADDTPYKVVHNLSEIYARQIPLSRLLTGLALFTVWPFALWLGLFTVQATDKTPAMLVNLCGLLMGALCYAGSFLPPPMTVLALLLPLLVSLTIILLTFGLPLQKALATWAVHWVAVMMVGLAVFTIAESYQLKEGFNVFREIRNVAESAMQTDPDAMLGTQFPKETLPIETRVVWRSTGSAWLDRRGGPIQFTILSETEKAGLKFQIYDESGALVFDYIEVRKFERFFEPTLEKEYRVVLAGNTAQSAQIIVEGLYPLEFLP